MTISVIIPAYNAETTIAETLDSIFAQTIKPYEVIVVNDGSIDSTAAISKSHPLAPEVISTDNQGAASALNQGISVAAGEFIAFLDADDLWLESKLELQSTLLEKKPDIDMVFSKMDTFVCPSVPEMDAKRLVYPDGPQPGYVVGTMIVRRNVFMQCGLFDPVLRTGYFIDWFSRAKAGGVKSSMLPEILLSRRIRPGTLSQRKSGTNDPLSSDFLEIARRSILRKRNTNDNAN